MHTKKIKNNFYSKLFAENNFEESSVSMEELLTIELYPELSEPWDCPCLICDHLERCGIGQEFNPIGCPWMNHFITLMIEKEGK